LSTVKLIRWTTAKAGAEFGCDPATLANKIKREGLLPGDDGMFSTRDICSAVFGDMEGEKLRNLRRDAELKEVELGRLKRELIPAENVQREWSAVIIAIRQAIWNFDAPEAVRRQWLGELRDLKIEDYFDSAKPVELDED
jgi:hypothetical protein